MDCRRVQDWLLQADEPRPERSASAELQAHVRGCEVCRVLVAKLARLEDAWRELPVPAAAEQSRDTFLRQLSRRQISPAVKPAARRLVFLHFARPRWAMAALLFLVVSLGLWLLAPSAKVHADSPTLVEQLVEWNVSLAQADTAEEREQRYAEHAAKFREALQQPDLSAEDKQLAQDLMDNGKFLAENDDPLAAADRMNNVADQMVERMNRATVRGNEREVGKLARNFSRVTEQGIGANLEKAELAAEKNPKQRERIAEMTKKEEHRAAKLETLAKQAPTAAQKEVRHAQETAVKQAKKHHKGK